jgi:hypothetical protein
MLGALMRMRSRALAGFLVSVALQSGVCVGPSKVRVGEL